MYLRLLDFYIAPMARAIRAERAYMRWVDAVSCLGFS